MFENGMPWILPLACGDLARSGQINIQDIPAELEIFGATYPLGGLTFWNGRHFVGRVKAPNGKWFGYDGLKLQSLLQEAGSMKSPAPVGFTLSSAVYFKQYKE